VIKDIIFKILKSIFITLAVAIAISYFLSSFNIPFLNTFLFTVGLQFLFFYFYGGYVIRKGNKLRIQAELKFLEETARQKTAVTCPCDKRVEAIIPIDLSRDINKYVCMGCNKNISVFSEFKTALATDPIDLNSADLEIVSKIKNDTI
jgi:hypothetical protein